VEAKLKNKKHMEQQKVDMFVGLNNENFNPQDLMVIKQRLEQMDDSKIFLIQGTTFQKPTTILLLAIFLGIERFWLEEIGLGILKIISFFFLVGLFWWFIDIFTAKNRARKYNFKKITKATMLA
jgi:TM2 domain-containing membrane protein YozV